MQFDSSLEPVITGYMSLIRFFISVAAVLDYIRLLKMAIDWVDTLDIV